MLNLPAFLNTLTLSARTLPIVIYEVTEGCNLRCVMCSYRNPLPGELTLAEIETLAASLRRLGLRHIVYSGGEPLLRRDLPAICSLFEGRGVRQTLLTNGLLLEKRLPDISRYFSEFIVSLDGPDESTHNTIRGVNSFSTIIRGIKSALAAQGTGTVSIRYVIQKRNFRHIAPMVEFAKDLGVKRISFLAADVLSGSFGRPAGTPPPDEQVSLSPDETIELRRIVESMIERYRNEIENHFIAESPHKLLQIVRYFEALAGKGPFPRNTCNAPMVSAVISSTGAMHPCFFLPSFGNIRASAPSTLIASEKARDTRRHVREYDLERCQTCVCTLHVRPVAALLDRF